MKQSDKAKIDFVVAELEALGQAGAGIARHVKALLVKDAERLEKVLKLEPKEDGDEADG